VELGQPCAPKQRSSRLTPSFRPCFVCDLTMSWWSKAPADAPQQGGAYSKDYNAGWADRQAQAMKMGTAAVPGGQQFQFFPVQVGGPTPYARSRRPVFVGICIYQALMAILALIEFANFLSGIIMIMGLMVAFWAFKEDMNITYVCWWGVLCLAGFVGGLVAAFIGFAVKISTIVLKFNIPFSCLLGMGLAWFLYVDYETEHHCTDTVGSWLRALGLLKEPPPPAASMSQSWLPQFGNVNNSYDDIQKQAGSYGSMAKDQMFGYQAQMQAKGNAAYGEASNYGSNLLDKVPHAAPLPKGAHDTKADPFMTL